MSFYTKHLFFCLNKREEGKKCCAEANAEALCKYAKKRIKKLELPENYEVRVNRAGCLGQCKRGPILVIYPDAVWYTYKDEADIDEIIEEHIIKGKPVERLLLDD